MTFQLPITSQLPFKFIVTLLFLGFAAIASAGYIERDRYQSLAKLEGEKWCELEKERLSLMDYSRFKHKTIEELAAGRLTLQDATTMWLELDSQRPMVMANLRKTLPGDTDLEREARCIARFAFNHSTNPGARALLAARIDAEFVVLFPNTTKLSSTSRPGD
jgi:hypothetical protein